MSTTLTASQRIADEVTSWPGVTSGAGRFGALAFSLGQRELGHLHGDHAFHAGFPRALWDRLYAQGRIDHHPIFPDHPGWAQRRIENDEDIEDVIALLRLNYDRAVAVAKRASG